MRMRHATVGSVLFAAACASSGTGSAPAPVPVYDSESVACRFEVVQRVAADVTVAFMASREEYLRERDQVLGREGARVGADAVVVEPIRAVGTGVISMPANQVPSTRTSRAAGDAVRFVEPGCAPGR